jgi:4-amino-4-deoxy-L-arabinose transferase-like glycosyltransferase
MTLFLPIEAAYILIAIIFFTSVYLTFKDLYKSFVALIFLMPLMHKEIFSLAMWDLLPIRVFAVGMGLVLGFKFLVYLRKEGIEKAWNSGINDPFFIIFGALWFFRLVSIYNSADSQRSLFLLAFFSLTFIIYFAYKLILLNNPDRFKDLIKVYLLVGFLTEIFAIVQYYLRLCCRETVGAVWVIPGFTPRLGSSFWDVNHYGAFLITLIPLIFNFMIASKKWSVKIMYLAYLGLSVWLLFMTQSRSAWIGLAIGSFITFLIYFWNALRKAVIAFLAAAVIGFLGLIIAINVLNINIKDSISEYMHHRLDSTDTHFMLLTASAEIFYDNFFFGSGYGTFDSAFRETETAVNYFEREPKLVDSLVPSHSIWGEVLGEGGAVGITLYTIFMLLIIGSLIYEIKTIRSHNSKYVGIGLLGGLISILSSGLFYSYNMEFYWIFIFACIGYILISMNFQLKVKEMITWWSSLPIAPYLLIIPVAFFFIFINLGQNSLIDYDEAIYAKVSKNIVQTNDWITLKWKDLDNEWFEKPPLYMWMTALWFKITGFGEFAVRFTSAVFGLLGVLFVFLFGRRLYNKTTGLIAALIMISVVHYMYYARNGMLDVTVTFFIFSSLYFFYKAYKKDPHYIWWYLISGMLVGLAVMTKSIIGLLPLPIIFLYLASLKLINRERISLSFKGLGLMVLGLIAIAGPWHVYSYYLHGQEFLDEYLIEHIFKRGMTGLGHKAPLLWYLEVIKVSFRIWILPLIPGLFLLPFLDKEKRNAFSLLFVSILVIFTFFSSSEDKLQWYIIPIYPFLALIAARFIERFIIIGNDLIKKDYSLSPTLLRGILFLGIFLTSVFYFLWNKDKVYYPDFNEDKVALIKIFNEKYPIEEKGERTLNYNKLSEPIMLFYSDHPIKSVSKDDIIDKIEDAAPDKNYSFLTSAKLFYEIRDMANNVNFPLAFDNQGSAGDWLLYRSLSRVEILQLRMNTLRLERETIMKGSFVVPLTRLQRQRLIEIDKENLELIKQLTDYGYPPAIPPVVQ